MKERKQFTKEFKEGAVRLVTEQGRTRLGRGSDVSASRRGRASRWVKAAKTGGGWDG